MLRRILFIAHLISLGVLALGACIPLVDVVQQGIHAKLYDQGLASGLRVFFAGLMSLLLLSFIFMTVSVLRMSRQRAHRWRYAAPVPSAFVVIFIVAMSVDAGALPDEPTLRYTLVFSLVSLMFSTSTAIVSEE